MRPDTVLVANRGAIATRIIRTLKAMGLRSIAVYSEADAESLHVLQADEAFCIGPAPAAQSYLDADRIIAVAREAGAGLLHPGYGFLAENAEFAEKCAAAGIAFVGPTPENIRTFGLKHTARYLAEASGVPLAPGSGLLDNADEAVIAARGIGFPIILKATAGGGGIGMRICETEADIHAAFASVARLGSSNFGDGGVFLERHVARAPPHRGAGLRRSGTATSCICSANATARSSAATRRSSRKRRPSPRGERAALRRRMGDAARRGLLGRRRNTARRGHGRVPRRGRRPG